MESTMKAEEIAIQDKVRLNLEKKEIYPVSIIYTRAISNSGLLAITFFTKEDLKRVKEIINYDYLCDRSGCIILEANNTMILSGYGLVDLYTKI